MNRSPFIVYVLPVILSVSLGTFVMAEALNDSDRELNFLQSGDMSSDSSNKIDIIGLKTNYSASESIQFNVKITYSDFECGDLYITIYKIIDSQDQVITQTGYLKQCFIKDQQNLPIGDNYSEFLTETGKYRIVIEIFDEKYKDSLSYTEVLTVK